MKQYADLDKLKEYLDIAEEHHNRARQAVRVQEDLLTAPMMYGSSEAATQIENYQYTLASLLHPQLHRGRTVIGARGPSDGIGEMHASMLPHVIRKTFATSNFDTLVKGPCLMDMILGWGVTEIRHENARYDRQQKAVLPVPTYVDPEDMLVYPDGSCWEECSVFFRRVVTSRKKLLKMAKIESKWDVDAINRLHAYTEDGTTRVDTSDRVEYFEGWARPADDSEVGEISGNVDEYDGVRFWIAEDGTHLRPMEHSRQLEGTPYTVWGATRVHKRIYPLGLATALGPGAEEIEEQSRDIDNAVRRQRRLVFTSLSETDLEKATETEHGGVIPLGPNTNKDSIWSVDLFGPLADWSAWLQMKKEAMDRVSGITDMMRGKTGSRVSATEATMVHSASNSRLAGLETSADTAIRRVAEQVSFYLTVDERVKVHLFGDGSQVPGIKDPVWRGGLDGDVTWESLGIELLVGFEAESSPTFAAQKMLQAAQVAAQFAQLKQAFPEANIDEVFRRVADAMQIPEMRDLIFGDPKPDPAPAAPTQARQGGVDTRVMPQMGMGGPMGGGL